jgi:ribosome-binding factor A
LPKDYPRSRRIAEQIQRELADIIRFELKDPRVGMITLTDVEVTEDNAFATVYFTHLGDAAATEETLAALEHAAGFLRRQLAGRLKLRTVPQLRFRYDVSIERGARVSRLIEAAVAEDASRRGKKR